MFLLVVRGDVVVDAQFGPAVLMCEVMLDLKGEVLLMC